MNIKPLLPGHVLVCPLNPALKRLTDLSRVQLADLWETVQTVQRMLARAYFGQQQRENGAAADAHQQQNRDSNSSSRPTPPRPEDGSFNVALQDGAEAGQTVAHVHVHVIPRLRSENRASATAGMDELYERMAQEPGNVGGHHWDRELGRRPQAGGAFASIEDAMRQTRSLDDMVAEADGYRELLEAMLKEAQEGEAER